MSDGPHRSLNMPPAWKLAAESLDRDAWTSEQRAERVCEAIRKDIVRNVPEGLRSDVQRLLGVSDQIPLFKEQAAKDLAALQDRMSLSPVARSLVDYAEHAATRGLSGAAAYEEAIRNTCLDHGGEGIRSMEEHYKREASPSRADRVRDRAELTLRSSQFDSIVRDLASNRPSGIRADVVAGDHRGLEDGPELRK